MGKCINVKNHKDCKERMVLLKYLKIYLDTDLIIILLKYQNNYTLGRLIMMIML